MQLEKQIEVLKGEGVKRYDNLKSITSDASKAINDLLRVEKENSGLRHELLGVLNRCDAEADGFKKKMKEVGTKLKAVQLQARRLKKRCDRAASIKEKAVQRAKEQTQKDARAYKLLNKGVYTEDTRSLIRLLVQAGCSREHVSKVIHAVLGAAGIAVKGLLADAQSLE